ncbi:MAG: hypothetical protein WC372_04960 [Candidatus Neomarinimicrobiota bacterium]|jgi:uncharacterized membrane protein HdeD (DUF308 family)|nr:hypothetical protein [Candidatus Neomarinimicrobiota bacterium]MDX9780128.1 hypothetical protein [bacterium]
MKKNTKKVVVSFGVLGLLLGAFIGFLSRPSSPIAGRVSFIDALTRGASLEGVNQVMLSLAQRSFDIMLIGALIGLVAGLLAACLIKR